MGRLPLPPDQRKPKLSGAQRRKQQYEREEAADKAARAGKAKASPTKRTAVAAQVAPSPSEESEEDDGDDLWAQEFSKAGKPDFDNPDTDLAYVRKLQLIVLRQMATTARPPKPQQDAWRRIREMSAVVGMTSNRAKLEADVRDLKKKLARFKDKATALQTEPSGNVPRPPTARGRKRGPRPLPDDRRPPG